MDWSIDNGLLQHADRRTPTSSVDLALSGCHRRYRHGGVSPHAHLPSTSLPGASSRFFLKDLSSAANASEGLGRCMPLRLDGLQAPLHQSRTSLIVWDRSPALAFVANGCARQLLTSQQSFDLPLHRINRVLPGGSSGHHVPDLADQSPVRAD